MRLGLLTTLWRRHDLARIVLRHHAGLDIPGIEIVPVAVGSEHEAKRIADEEGWHFVRHKNSPLSDKHNAGLRALAGANVDGVVVIGSDDLLNAAYFEEMAARLASGQEAIELRGIYFYDAPNDELMYANQWSTGVGRCFSSSLLRRRDWTGWESGHDRRIDITMTKPLLQWANPRTWISDLRTTDIRVVDIKTGDGMWSFDWCKSICRPDRRHPVPDSRAWFDRHFPGVFDSLTEINPTT